MAGDRIQMTDELREYLLDHSIPRDDFHRRLVADTHERYPDSARMQISEEQGPLLQLLVRLLGARNAVEIGTFTGLSALWIARGVGADGHLTCFDMNEEWTSRARSYWSDAGVADRIELIIGPAVETVAAHQFDAPVDFAFIDADKGGYLDYVDLLLQRMDPGGLIVADNALFSGQVLDPDAIGSAEEIRRFNDAVAVDPRVDCALINVGDGLMLMRKR